MIDALAFAFMGTVFGAAGGLIVAAIIIRRRWWNEYLDGRRDGSEGRSLIRATRKIPVDETGPMGLVRLHRQGQWCPAGGVKQMTRTDRAAIIAHLDRTTKYDATTIRFHRDGTISGILDADKTSNGPHTDRVLIGYADDLLTEAQA
jgi:hypothetical protein